MKVSEFVEELLMWDQDMELAFVVDGSCVGDPTLKTFIDEDGVEFLDIVVV